jgi:hypothetical protein
MTKCDQQTNINDHPCHKWFFFQRFIWPLKRNSNFSKRPIIASKCSVSSSQKQLKIISPASDVIRRTQKFANNLKAKREKNPKPKLYNLFDKKKCDGYVRQSYDAFIFVDRKKWQPKANCSNLLHRGNGSIKWALHWSHVLKWVITN